MSDKKINELKNKVIDFKRFAFILLALCGFISLGLVLPHESVAPHHQTIMIGMLVVMLMMAFVFHRIAMHSQQKLYEEE
ncbi:YrhC family protein [Evansella cellulosilytica]|uniref:YrhC-like protein n=1 Tax=Evansella cellulosilytica (strain ATCC 21833 / DSM 2522 / FERM P-1141 / JCM 9156 / N-4) TaxID=649639 RepID=E6TVC4_EVAC2|nr:YrhC family protein [Evansella cellulosilytica]ADU29808.1 hypothetical protein Bcell_1545 [Evansella cellulosilytica DSM 2522]